MKWCDQCGMRLQFMKKKNKWIPLDEEGNDHRPLCQPIEHKKKRIDIVINKSKRHAIVPLQIGEDEYII